MGDTNRQSAGAVAWDAGLGTVRAMADEDNAGDVDLARVADCGAVGELAVDE